MNQPEKPNVILCMADDMGWGDAAFNGHSRIHTPCLDEMAQNGVQFNRFYAGASVCSPTRGSVLTGRNPYRYGIFHANVGHLKAEEINLAELFRELGYTTGHFGKWHLGTLFPDYSGKGEQRNPSENYMTPGMAGFDNWFSTEFAIATYDPYVRDREHSHGKDWLENGDRRMLYVENGIPVEENLEGCDSKIIMDRAIPFIEHAVKENKPFFAVIWFHAPHTPVIGHPEYMKELYSDLPEEKQHYYSVITALDAQMGRLRTRLSELGVSQNTMVCFTSDNGPEGNPGPRGRSQGSVGDLRGRKRSLYEGGIRVPGLIEWPAFIKDHKEIDIPVVTSDYFPTVCEIMGYTMKDDRPVDGLSLLDIINGKQQKREKAIGFQFDGHQQKALIGDRYKLVHNEGDTQPGSDNSNLAFEEFELYDLVDDPGETKNIAAQHPAILKEMKTELEAFVLSCERSNRGEDY